MLLGSLLVLPGPRTAGAATTPIGPGVAGQVHALCFDPDDPDIVYIGGDVCGVYRSLDGGEHWAPFRQGLVDTTEGEVTYVDDLLVLRNQPGVAPSRRGVYAATLGGLFFLPDGSDTWQLLTSRTHYSYYEDPSQSAEPTPIPFSTLAYDAVEHVLWVGAGSSRWVANGLDGTYPDLNENTFSGFQSSPGEIYSMWRLCLDTDHVQDTLAPVANLPMPNIGHVRQLAATVVDGVGYVAVAAEKGFYLYDTASSVWEDLNGTDKRTPGLVWPGNYWGVAFGAGSLLYGLQHRSGEGLHATVDTFDVAGARMWGPVAEDAPVVPTEGSVTQWVELLANPDFDLTRLSVVAGDGTASDVVFVGERRYTNMNGFGYIGGYYMLDLDCAGGPQWRHILGQSSDYNYWYLPANDCSVTEPISFDNGALGWLDTYFFTPTIPLAVCPQDHQRMIAWLYHNPMLSTDGGGTWHQINADGSMASGWQSRGANLMAVSSLAMTADGRLVVGSWDFGTFVSAGPDNRFYHWWNRFASGPRSIIDVAVYDDRLYGILKASPNDSVQHQTVLIQYSAGVGPDDPYVYDVSCVEIDHDIQMYYKSGGPYTETALLFLDDGTLFVTVVVDTDGGRFSDLWRGSQDTAGHWSWQRWNASSQDMIPRFFGSLLALPGTSYLLVGSKNGGLLCFDRDDPTYLAMWLDSEQGGVTQDPWLRNAAKSVHALACDSQGTVLYVGTSGSQGRIGTVLRLNVPFDGVPSDEDWAVLANGNVTAEPGGNGDTFGIGTNVYHEPGTAWPWTGPNEMAERMTQITSLVVDDRDPRVVYAGVQIKHAHPGNGVWRYDGSAWQRMTEGPEAPTRGITCLVKDPVDPSRLYAGTGGGQELFEVTVPEVPEMPAAKFVDRSQEIYEGVEESGLRYEGIPYAMLALDYDNDGDQDLLVSFQGPNPAQRFTHDGQAGVGVPLMVHWSEPVLEDNACRGLSCADYDNDGRLDVFVAHQTRPKLLHNIWTDSSDPETDPVFEDEAQQLGMAALATDSWCGAWGDYDRDGQVDLFVGRAGGAQTDPLDQDMPDLQGTSNVLLHNTVLLDGLFHDDSGQLTDPQDPNSWTVTASWQDVDGDGDPDLLVGDIGVFEVLGGPLCNNTALYINQGDGTFTCESQQRLDLCSQHWQGGVSWSDYDHDGDWDLVSAGLRGTRIYFNDGQGFFDAGSLGLNDGAASAALPLDFDLDNATDFLVLSHPSDVLDHPLQLLHADAGGGFQDLAPSFGMTNSGVVLGGTVADMTDDGDLDMLLGEPAGPDTKYYYQNANLFGGEQPVQHWAGLHLVGDGGTNVAAIGAVVDVVIDGVTYRRYVDGGSGLGGQQSLILHWGLPAGETAPQALIRWPDGYEQTVTLVQDQVLTVRDDTPPQYVAGSFHVGLSAKPGDLVDWSIEWDTQYGSDPSLEQFTVSDNPRSPSPCWQGTHTYTPGMPNVTSTITPLSGGGYHHVMIWSDRPCGTGCSYRITASSGTWNTDGTVRRSGTEQQTVSLSVCLPNIQQ